MMHDDYGLPERTLMMLKNYFVSQPQVKKAMIFGSRAKGNYKKVSDIDFAVWFEDDADLSARIRQGLDDLPMPYKIDVVDYDRLRHEGLKDHIDRVGKLFYEKTAS